MNENAIEAIDWANWAPNIRDPRLLAPGGMGVIFQSNTAGITYDSQRVSGEEVPRSLDDLLKPQYKGRLASTPYAAHFDKLATPEVWGEQRTLDYSRKLAEQIAGLIRCNESERLLSGEFDVLVLDCDQSNALGMKARGLPIDFAMMPEAPFVQHRYAAVPRTAAHPNAARLWIDYLLTREAQDVIYETTFADSSFVPGSKTAEILTRFQATGAKLVRAGRRILPAPRHEEELRRVLAQVQQILPETLTATTGPRSVTAPEAPMSTNHRPAQVAALAADYADFAHTAPARSPAATCGGSGSRSTRRGRCPPATPSPSTS